MSSSAAFVVTINMPTYKTRRRLGKYSSVSIAAISHAKTSS